MQGNTGTGVNNNIAMGITLYLLLKSLLLVANSYYYTNVDRCNPIHSKY